MIKEFKEFEKRVKELENHFVEQVKVFKYDDDFTDEMDKQYLETRGLKEISGANLKDLNEY